MQNNHALFLFCFLASSLLLCPVAKSQPFTIELPASIDPSIKKIKETAEISFNNATNYCQFEFASAYCQEADIFFLQARENLQKLHSIYPNNHDINFGLGISTFFSNNKYAAFEYLQKARCKKYNTQSLLLYYLAKSFQLNHMWDSAIVTYNLFRPIIKNKEINTHIEERELLKSIEECEFAKKLKLPLYAAEIKNIGTTINTGTSEYSPVLINNGKIILYTSPRFDSIADKKKNNDHIPFESIYMNYYINNNWSDAIRLDYPINKDKQNNAILSVASDGKTVLLYKEGDIYISYYENEMWADPLIIEGEINTKEQESSACFSPDMKYIYFSSRRKESYGGLDIFRCEYSATNTSCNNVENLGTTINTPSDEDGMFLHADNTSLYFSSNGKASIGGFDIFIAQLTDTGWSKPTNMGMPLNSADDDIFFSLNNEKTSGYFTSYRKDSYGEKDIYQIDFKKPLTEYFETNKNKKSTHPAKEHAHQATIELKGYVEDNVRKKGCSASITIINNETTDSTKVQCSEDGTFTVQLESTYEYTFVIKEENYYTKQDTILLPAGTSEYKYSTSLSPISNWKLSTSEKFVIEKYKDSILVEGELQDFAENTGIIGEIIFSSSGESIQKKISTQSEKFSVNLPKGKTYKVSIKADNYFHQSAVLNTASANNYKYIDAKMIKTSETLLKNTIPTEKTITITDNTLALLVAEIDTPDSLQDNATITITNNETKDTILNRQFDTKSKQFQMYVPANKTYEVSIKAEGYFHQSQNLFIGQHTTKAELTWKLEAITRKEKKLLLTPITFETNVFHITESNKHIVEAVLKTVAEKNIKSLEIIGHTDNIGTEQSNLELSEKRAKTIAQYFIENNIITQKQAVPIGRGEEEPIWENQTEEGRSKNRRVQLILTYLE